MASRRLRAKSSRRSGGARGPAGSSSGATFRANHVQVFVLVVLAHPRRRVLPYNVTEHPTAYWTAQPIMDAFPDDAAPGYLLRDRDTVCVDPFRQRVRGMRIREALTTAQSPWADSFVDRLSGSIRQECLAHGLGLHEPPPHPDPLRRVLSPPSDSPLAPDRCPRRAAERAIGGGQGRADPRSRGSPSSIRPAGGLIRPPPNGPAPPHAYAHTIHPSRRRHPPPVRSTAPWQRRRLTAPLRINRAPDSGPVGPAQTHGSTARRVMFAGSGEHLSVVDLARKHHRRIQTMTKSTFTAILEREGDLYVALCPELDIASQGPTIEEATTNLREAVALFLETADSTEITQRLRAGVFVTTFDVVDG